MAEPTDSRGGLLKTKQTEEKRNRLIYHEINVVYCVGRVEIQIEIQRGRCTADTDSMV